MQISRDAATGTVLVIAGVAMFAGARGFELPAGITYGAGFFPKIVSCGMAISGILVLLGDLRQRERDWVKIDWQGVGRIALLVVIIVAYALALDPLGFHFSTIALLFAVAMSFRAGVVAASVLSVVATLVLHFVFYSVMKVSLPWGVLLPSAW